MTTRGGATEGGPKTSSRDDEESLVDWVRAQAAEFVPNAAVGPGDDAAVLRFGEDDLVVTTDLVAEDTHFFPDTSGVQVGRFAATVNLSDLAAMGAEPRGLVAACCAPRTMPGAWFRDVAQGLLEVASRHDCPLLGGDMKTAPARMVAATALGRVPHDQALLRSGARPGDILVATGRFGGPAAALRLLEAGRVDRAAAMQTVFDVAPRLPTGLLLREVDAHAAVDTSDGLARAVTLLARESGCRAEIDLDAVPVHPLAQEACGNERSGESWLRTVTGTGGEYELVAALTPAQHEEVAPRAEQAGTQLVPIGTFRDGAGAVGKTGGRTLPLEHLGWRQR